MSKVITIIIAILLVPVFMWLQNNHYHEHNKPELLQQAKEILSQDKFEKTDVSLDRLDATLTGLVSSFDRRIQAQKLVDDINGVRVRPLDNQLKVPGWLNIQRDYSGPTKITGLLPKNAQSNYTVTRLVNKIDKNAKIDFQQHVALPNIFASGDIKKLSKKIFATKGKRTLYFKVNNLTIKGDATLARQNEWQKDIEQYAPDNNINFDTTLYASRFHLPSYQHQSIIDKIKAAQIVTILKSLVIYFDSGSTEISDSEQIKIYALARLMNNTKNVTYVAGGHADATGSTELNLKIAQQRANAVLDKLVQQTVDRKQIEVVSFGATQNIGQTANEDNKRLSRRVELLIK